MEIARLAWNEERRECDIEPRAAKDANRNTRREGGGREGRERGEGTWIIRNITPNLP